MPNMMNVIQGMLRMGGNNPQAMAQKILRENPQFAQQLQGKNPQQLAQQIMQQNGMNIDQVMQMLGVRR